MMGQRSGGQKQHDALGSLPPARYRERVLGETPV